MLSKRVVLSFSPPLHWILKFCYINQAKESPTNMCSGLFSRRVHVKMNIVALLLCGALAA